MTKPRAVIFGTGRTAQRVYSMAKDAKDILFFVDTDSSRWGKKLLGLQIKSPDVLLDYSAYDQVIIGAMCGTEIFNQLSALGVPETKRSCEYIMFLLENQSNVLSNGQKYWAVYNNRWGFQEIAEYEARWCEIRSKHDAVKIFCSTVDYIGEVILRYFAIRQNEQDNENRILNVFLPSMGKSRYRILNKKLFELFNQHIYVPQGEDLLFWLYVCTEHFVELDSSQLNKYALRNNFPPYGIEPYRHDFVFRNEDVSFAKAQMKKMQVGDNFVCVAARSSDYHKKIFGSYPNEDFRNVDFNTYKDAISYLKSQNFQAVRMGRELDPLVSAIDNCVDYAGQYSNDLMDLYLAAHCRFVIGNSSGIPLMGSLFGKPVLMVDVVLTSLGYGAMPFTKYDLYIPKKYFDTHKQRYLSLREMTQVERRCYLSEDSYKSEGIYFEDNSPEEIRDVLVEFMARLNGTWRDTEDDLKNYEQYQQIYNEMSEIAKANPKLWGGGPIACRLSATYLRYNRYLLA